MSIKRTLSGKEVFFSLVGAVLFIWFMAEIGGLDLISKAITPEQIPDTFEQAGISNKHWSSENAHMAAKITVRVLQRIDDGIADADKRGDSAAVTLMLDKLLPIIRGWNDQQDNVEVGKYHNCVLATIHTMDGATSVMRGGRYTTRDHFRSALDACRSSI